MTHDPDRNDPHRHETPFTIAGRRARQGDDDMLGPFGLWAWVGGFLTLAIVAMTFGWFR